MQARKTQLYYLGGFAVVARSRKNAVTAFVRHGFSKDMAQKLVKPITRVDQIPFGIL